MISRNMYKLEQAFVLCCKNPLYKVLFVVSDVAHRKELMMYARELAALSVHCTLDVEISHMHEEIRFSNGSKIMLRKPEYCNGIAMQKVFVDEAVSFSAEWEHRLKALERNI